MIERVAQAAPLACYGNEQKSSDLRCVSCSHKIGCAELMGRRLDRVPVDETHFNLIPKQLAEISWNSDDEFKQAYDECYRIIFGVMFEPDSLHKRPGLREFVEAEAEKLNCPLKLFLLTVMWGHREKNQTGRFYCTMLGGDAAARRVTAYRAEVEAQYGTFTEKTLAEYAESLGKSYERQLLDAEIVAGNWTIGYKLKRGGPVEMPFFESNEFNMPDLWLAIEPHYFKFLVAWNKNRTGTSEQKKKRIRVIKLTTELRRHSKHAIAVFKAREKIMPMAIKKVLSDKGFAPNQFKINPQQQIEDTFLFWSRLGMAVQHLWCWEYLKGDRHNAVRQLGIGTCHM